MIESKLFDAYIATEYQVYWGSGSVILRIDQPSPDLARLHAAMGVSTSAFISAWNPSSKLAPASINEAAQQHLERMLETLGIPVVPGEGADPTGQWPAERSVLALGISCDEACRVGRLYQQNAIVFADQDVTPRLVIL